MKKVIAVLIFLTLAGVLSCVQQEKNKAAAAFDDQEFNSPAMKGAKMSFEVADAASASYLVKKTSEDRYISAGRIGKFGEVAGNSYELYCKFESYTENGYGSAKAALQNGKNSFPVVRVAHGGGSSGGYALEHIDFSLNDTGDLHITCSKIYVEGRPIKVETVKRALSGTLELRVSR